VGGNVFELMYMSDPGTILPDAIYIPGWSGGPGFGIALVETFSAVLERVV